MLEGLSHGEEYIRENRHYLGMIHDSPLWCISFIYSFIHHIFSEFIHYPPKVTKISWDLAHLAISAL